jgi:hypothetical protein
MAGSSPLYLTNDLLMMEQLDQEQPAIALVFQEELTQAIEIWNQTPVSILHEQAVHTHALLLVMGKYITYRKEKGEFETCADASDFLNRLIKGL